MLNYHGNRGWKSDKHYKTNQSPQAFLRCTDITGRLTGVLRTWNKQETAALFDSRTLTNHRAQPAKMWPAAHNTRKIFRISVQKKSAMPRDTCYWPTQILSDFQSLHFVTNNPYFAPQPTAKQLGFSWCLTAAILDRRLVIITSSSGNHRSSENRLKARLHGWEQKLPINMNREGTTSTCSYPLNTWESFCMVCPTSQRQGRHKAISIGNNIFAVSPWF